MSVKAVTAAGALASAALLTGGPAFASGINISPSVAHRGDTITVTGGCQAGGVHPDTWASLSGSAVDTTGDNINGGAFSLTTSVKDRARLGTSTITVTCNNSKNQYQGSLRVISGTISPTKFPRTGGGGMASASQDGGLPLGGWAGAAGMALLAGAVAVGGVTLVRSRARSRSRGRD